MSISGAFANARSGLTLNARAAELVSSNIANALTPNHARQEIVAKTMRTGGVDSGQVVRASDAVAMAAKLSASAAAASARTTSQGRVQIANLLGSADGSSGLAPSLNAFGVALSQASVSPENHAGLEAVLSAAHGVAEDLNAAATGLRDLRNDADASIAQRTSQINEGLLSIDDLNAQIVTAMSIRQDTAALQQEREGYILELSQHIPVSVVNRQDGRIALFSERGATLLDGAPATFGFEASGVVGDDATIADGTVGGITMNGLPMDGGSAGLLSGGGLSADFDMRDVIVPQAQTSLDDIAGALLARLDAADTSLGPGEGGILTDEISAYDPSRTTGLASRVRVNPSFEDPSGLREKLHSGLGSLPGPDTGVLGALTAALTRQDADLSASGDLSRRDIAGHASAISSGLHVAAYRAEESSTQAAAKSLSAETNHAQSVGVDSDLQLQKLLQIENAYAANARVIATADAMMQRLLEL